MTDETLTPEMLLTAYANGYFPMAMERDDPELYWFSPEERGVIPLDTFNLPRGLKRAMKTHDYTITIDHDFEAVIRACGAKTAGRDETWVNEPIIALYTALHRMGHAHSVEVWRGVGGVVSPSPLAGEGWDGGTGSDGADRDQSLHPLTQPSPARGEGYPSLIGGLYGISLGAAFFGESMFSRATDASKCALVMLVSLLRECGYTLLDTQYVNDHLKQFGVMAVKKKDYMMKLEKALSASPNPSSRFSTASVRRGAASASSLSDTFES